MKKLSIRQKIRQRRIQAIRARRRQRRREKSRHQRIEEIRIPAPATLSLSRNYQETVAFLKKIKDEAKLSAKPVRNRQIFIDLKPITDLAHGAALVLAAEIDRWRRLQDLRLKPKNSDSWQPEVKGFLKMLGFFELLKVNPHKVSVESSVSDQLSAVPLTTGTEMDAERIFEIIKSFDNLRIADEDRTFPLQRNGRGGAQLLQSRLSKRSSLSI